MANVSFDSMWQEAMAELGEQLHVEGVDNEELDQTSAGVGGTSTVKSVSLS